MSHELRTPLNAIIGFSELLEEKLFGALNPKQEEYVTDILESGRHLLSLINDILDLAKIEAGKMELEPSSFPIATLIEDSLIMVKEKCHKHVIRLTTEIADSVKELVIVADERKLKQIMYNLLSNAAKFTPDGGQIRASANLTNAEVGTRNAEQDERGTGNAECGRGAATGNAELGTQKGEQDKRGTWNAECGRGTAPGNGELGTGDNAERGSKESVPPSELPRSLPTPSSDFRVPTSEPRSDLVTSALRVPRSEL